MILKQKKKLLYALAAVFGVVLTVFSIQKDNTDRSEDGNLGITTVNADVPETGYNQSTYYSQGGYYNQSTYYGQSGYYAQGSYYNQASYYNESGYYGEGSYSSGSGNGDVGGDTH